MKKPLNLRHSLLLLVGFTTLGGMAILGGLVFHTRRQADAARVVTMRELVDTQNRANRDSLATIQYAASDYITDELYAFEGRQYRDSVEQMRQQAYQLARALASLARPYLMNADGMSDRDVDEVNQICESLSNDPDIGAIVVENPRGGVLAGFRQAGHRGLIRRFGRDGGEVPDDVGQVVAQLRRNHMESALDESAPIVDANTGKLIGIARIVLLNDQIEDAARLVARRGELLKARTGAMLNVQAQKLEDTLHENLASIIGRIEMQSRLQETRAAKMLAIVAFVTMAAQIIAVYVVSSRVLNPLRHAIAFATELGRGDLERRLEPVRQPDINRLGAALNAAADALHAQGEETSRVMEELNHAVDAARAASRTKSIFLANMSHEIRTPMNGIIGLAELAADDDRLPPKTHDYLAKIHESAVGLLQIINDILDISKIEAGKVELESIPFAIGDVFDVCESVCAPKAAEKGLDLALYSEPSAGKRLRGDPTKLRQALLNLLSNAIKFTSAGTVKLTCLVDKATDDSVTLSFQVKDSGIGMTPAEIRNVFEPFTQADNSTTRKYGGTGLGLAITRSLVELMGGSLKVESMPGFGSRFSFSLTFQTLDDAAGGSPTSTDTVCLVRPMFHGDVLVCEDNAINQEVVQEHLLRVGLGVTVADNGRAGVEAVKERLAQGKRFDLVLMDIHMPVMDGIEAARKMKELGLDCPIVALTANVMQRDRDRYLAMGMARCLPKPFTAHELWSCLKKFLPLADGAADPASAPATGARDMDASMARAGVVDRRLGIERSAGNVRLYERLLANFYKDYADAGDELELAAARKDAVLAHRLAHTVKGVAGTIGALKLSEAARDLELAAAAENEKLFRIRIGVFRKELERVLRELEPLASRYGSQAALRRTARRSISAAPIDDGKRAEETLSRLDELLRAGDAESLALLPELERVLPKLAGMGNLGDRLFEQVEGYDFEPALETLAEVRRRLARWKGSAAGEELR